MASVSGEQRIRWNEDEVARLSQAALPLLIADSKMTIVEAVRKVQDTVIAADRRRNLINIGAVPVELRTLLDNRRKAASGKIGLGPEESKLLQEQNNTLIQQNKELVERCSQLEGRLASLENAPHARSESEVLEDFLVRIFTKAGTSLLEKYQALQTVPVEEVLATAAGRVAASHLSTEQQQTHRKPSILLCGVRPEHRARLESKFASQVRMQFWRDENLTLLSEKAKEKDMVFLLMPEMSHQGVKHVTSVTERYQRVPGHIEAMISAVEAFIARSGNGK